MGENGHLPFARNFRELVVYQRQRELAREVFTMSKSFPSDERFALTDQIRRSSRSIGAQIAEAWGKRRFERHFVSKLTDADAEQYETQHWIETACDCDYLTQDAAASLLRLCVEIGRMLAAMRERSERFCQETFRVQESDPAGDEFESWFEDAAG
jgi:four helix bundle protein